MSDKKQFDENETPVSETNEDLIEEKLGDEGWQDDAPPEDGFHDADTTSEEIVEDDEPAIEEDDGYDNQAPARDRGKTIFYGAMGVAALLVGGMLAVQFVGGPSDSPVPSVMNKLVSTATTPAAPAPQADASAAPTDGATDMSALYQPVNPIPQSAGSSSADAASSASSTDVVQLDGNDSTASAAPALDTPPTPAPLAAAVPAAPAPAAPKVAKVEEMPAPVMPAPKPEKVQPVAAQPAPMPVPAPVVAPLPAAAVAPTASVKASSDIENRLNAMADKIKSLESALDSATKQNSELVSRMETMGGDSGLEERLNRLEQRVSEKAAAVPAAAPIKTSVKAHAKVAKEPVRKETAANESTDGIVTDLLPEDQVRDVLSAEEAPAKVVKHASKAPKKAVEKKTKASKKTSAKAHRTASQGEGSMVLRAATPDAAWVSGDANSHDLQRVTVGESLPGIGKVKAIRQVGEGWEVVGSEGTLR